MGLTPTQDPTGNMSQLEIVQTDIGNLIQQVNAQAIDFNNFNTPLIIPDANGVPNVLLGPRQVNAQRGLFVAKPNVNVITATDDQLIFNSNQNVFKIISTSTVTLHRNSGDTTGTLVVPHNQPTVPLIIAFVLVSGARLPLPFLSTYPTGLGYMGIDKDIAFSVDATNITFFTDVDGGGLWVGTSEDFQIKYYILQETAI